MERIELSPGTAQLFGSSEALAAAIRRGEFAAQAWIYHRATATRISITLHPIPPPAHGGRQGARTGRHGVRLWRGNDGESAGGATPTRVRPSVSYLVAGEWESAAVLADRTIAGILGRPDGRFITGERALDPEHFGFRGSDIDRLPT